MYRIEKLFDSNLILDGDKYKKWTENKISLLPRVNNPLGISFTYDKSKNCLYANASMIIKKEKNLIYHGILPDYPLGEGIMQHPLCCGSVFLYGLSEELYCYYKGGDPKVYQIEFPIKDRLNLYIDCIRLMGYSTVQYIVASHQKWIKKALEEFGFKEIHSVKNSRSDYMLYFMQYDL